MRFLRHIFYSVLGMRVHFSKSDRAEIERAVAGAERGTSAEVCVALEATSSLLDLLSGKSCRERAWEIFSAERLWDTAHNTGILLYTSLSRRDVELIVDRGVAAAISDEELRGICAIAEESFRSGSYTAGIRKALSELHTLLLARLPGEDRSGDEIQKRLVTY